MSNIVCLYHAKCSDGIAAAYSVWRMYPEAAFIPMHYQTRLPSALEGKDVVMVDFSLPRKELVKLGGIANSVLIIDHHKTAAADLELLTLDCTMNLVFDMTKSGAVLTHEYFFPNEPVPDLLLHIQDRDLWEWKLTDTREVCAGFHEMIVNQRGSFMDISRLVENHTPIRTMGQALCAEVDRLVEVLMTQVDIQEIAGKRVAVIQLPEDSDSKVTYPISEAGNEACKRFDVDYASINFRPSNDPTAMVHSLRSIGDFDVSALAKRFGGGGHRNAAGYKTIDGLEPYVEQPGVLKTRHRSA